jgi:hypothetical protein
LRWGDEAGPPSRAAFAQAQEVELRRVRPPLPELIRVERREAPPESPVEPRDAARRAPEFAGAARTDLPAEIDVQPPRRKPTSPVTDAEPPAKHRLSPAVPAPHALARPSTTDFAPPSRAASMRQHAFEPLEMAAAAPPPAPLALPIQRRARGTAEPELTHAPARVAALASQSGAPAPGSNDASLPVIQRLEAGEQEPPEAKAAEGKAAGGASGGGADIDEIVDRALEKLARMLEIENERRGASPWH